MTRANKGVVITFILSDHGASKVGLDILSLDIECHLVVVVGMDIVLVIGLNKLVGQPFQGKKCFATSRGTHTIVAMG